MNMMWSFVAGPRATLYADDVEVSSEDLREMIRGRAKGTSFSIESPGAASRNG